MAQRRWQPLAGLAHAARWGADSQGYLNNGLVNFTGSDEAAYGEAGGAHGILQRHLHCPQDA